MSAGAEPSFWRSVRAVAWSFLGVRKNSEYRQDLARVSPLHVIAVGFLGVALLVGGLIAMVHWAAG